MSYESLNEPVYIIYNTKSKSIYESKLFNGKSFSTTIKRWKTLNGAIKGLDKIKKPENESFLEIRKLAVEEVS